MTAQAQPALIHERLRHEPLVGPFCKTSDPAMIEAIGHAGMHFVILDLEHGSLDIGDLPGLIRAAQATDTYPVVRTLRPDDIGRALDLGAAAVQVPHVETADHAAAVVQAARFAPQGQRGVCRYVRAARYGTTDKTDYFTYANRATAIVQVEGQAGLNNLDEILDVTGVDLVFVGVYDLSQSLGHPGEVNHPAVQDALQGIARCCKDRRIPVGTFVENPEDARRYADAGIHYLAYSVDVGLLQKACDEAARAVGSSDP
ncbi:MAG: aldolase/citrate lyase family protein [Planctomycetota bacterium]